jgi:hypothetical protein
MEDDLFWLIPITSIACAFAYIIVQTLAKARVRELQIRERIAMIERGLMPPPEVDPRGFDRAMNRLEHREYRHGSSRHRRAGVSLMGVGFGLIVLISFAFQNPSIAIGVGGFLVVMGLAFFINSLIDTGVAQSAGNGPRAWGGPAGPASVSGAVDPPRDSGI